MKEFLVRSLNNKHVSLDNNVLMFDSIIPENTEFYKIYLNNVNVTEKYYRFLQKNKVTQQSWRFSKSKNHFSVGTNSNRVIFNCLDDQKLINFINSNKDILDEAI